MIKAFIFLFCIAWCLPTLATGQSIETGTEHCPEQSCAEEIRQWKAAALMAKATGAEVPREPTCNQLLS